jgi:predicted PurR-regulated permease PerM
LAWGLRVAGEVGWRLLVLAAVIWVLIQVVDAISLLIISFASGLLITALLQPLTGRLKRMGLGRGAATAVTSFTGFGVMGLVGWFVVWQVMENVDDLVDSVTEGINELRDWLIDSPLGVSEEDLNEMVDNLNTWLSEHSAELTSAGLEGANYLLRFFSGAGVALFVVLFLLYDGRNIWYWCLKFLPASARPGVAGAGPRAWITLTGYVRGTVIVALIDAIGIGIGLYILDVPMAVPLSVIVFLFAFVPIIGAIVSGALAVVVAFVTEGPVTALLVLGVVLLVQQIESQILQPFILGRLVRVHPLAVVRGPPPRAPPARRPPARGGGVRLPGPGPRGKPVAWPGPAWKAVAHDRTTARRHHRLSRRQRPRRLLLRTPRMARHQEGGPLGPDQ